MKVRAMGLGAGTKIGFDIKLTKLDVLFATANTTSDMTISNNG